MSDKSLKWARALRENPPPPDAEYPDLITLAAEEGDWYSVYMWSKSWIHDGGATAPDPWLGYAIGNLLRGQPRGAINAIDKALRSWTTDPIDRAILLWARAAVIDRWLNDPKTALPDYQLALGHAPGWLAADAHAAHRASTERAKSSRKRKPSVQPSPSSPSHVPLDVVEPRDPTFQVGERSRLWDAFLAALDGSLKAS